MLLLALKLVKSANKTFKKYFMKKYQELYQKSRIALCFKIRRKN
jgi:hypothetical protein